VGRFQLQAFLSLPPTLALLWPRGGQGLLVEAFYVGVRLRCRSLGYILIDDSQGMLQAGRLAPIVCNILNGKDGFGYFRQRGRHQLQAYEGFLG
jgi:hypothetical protein